MLCIGNLKKTRKLWYNSGDYYRSHVRFTEHTYPYKINGIGGQGEGVQT